MAEITVLEECVFAAGRGNASRDVYCRLSDAVAVMAFVGKPEIPDEEGLRREFVALLRRMASMSNAFIYACEDLLGAVLRDYGFKVVYDSREAG